MSNTIRTGIIGFGLSGRVFHAPFINAVEGYELTKVSTANPKNIAIANERFPDTAVVPTPEEIIEDSNIDLVIVTSPNTDHFKWTKEALLAGKHVVVEKPFTVTVEEADALIEIAEKEEKILTVYHNRRFTSDTKTVKKILDSGMLGAIRDYETHFDRFRPEAKPGGAWREDPLPGSGVFYDLGSHLIDQALWFFGYPQSVTAHIGMQRPWAKADDSFDVKLHYEEFTATLKAGIVCKIPGPTYQLHGDNGSFVKYGLDVQEAAIDAGEQPNDDSWGREPEDIWGSLDVIHQGVKIQGVVESEQGDYRDYFINLRDAIRGETELAVKPEEARDVIKIIEAAFQSNNEKRTVEL